MYRRKQRLISIFLLILTIFNTIFIDTSIYAARKPVYDQQLVDEGSISNEKVNVLMYQVGDIKNASPNNKTFISRETFLDSQSMGEKDANTFRFYFPQFWFQDKDNKIKYIYKHKINDNKIVHFVADDKGDTTFNLGQNEATMEDHSEYKKVINTDIEINPIIIRKGMSFEVDLGRFYILKRTLKLYTEKGVEAFTGLILDGSGKPLNDYNLDLASDMERLKNDTDAGSKIIFESEGTVLPGDLLHTELSTTLFFDNSAGFNAKGERVSSSKPFTDPETFNQIKAQYNNISYDSNGMGNIKLDTYIKINGESIKRIYNGGFSKSELLYFFGSDTSNYLSKNKYEGFSFTYMTGRFVDMRDMEENKTVLGVDRYLAFIINMNNVSTAGKGDLRSNTFYIREFKNGIDLNSLEFYFIPDEAALTRGSNYMLKVSGLFNAGKVIRLSRGIDYNAHYINVNQYSGKDIVSQGFDYLKFKNDYGKPPAVKVTLNNYNRFKNMSGTGLILFKENSRNLFTLYSNELKNGSNISSYPGISSMFRMIRYSSINKLPSVTYGGIVKTNTKNLSEGKSQELPNFTLTQRWNGTSLNSSFFRYSYLENGVNKSGILELSKSNNYTKTFFVPENSKSSLKIEYIDKEKVPSGMNFTTNIDWENNDDTSWNNPNKGKMYNEHGELLYTIDKRVSGNTITFTNTRNILLNVFTNTDKEKTKSILSGIGFRENILENLNFEFLKGEYNFKNKASFNIVENQLVDRYERDNKVKNFSRIDENIGNLGAMFDKNELKQILKLNSSDLSKDLNTLNDKELKELEIDFNNKKIYSKDLFYETIDLSKLLNRDKSDAVDFNKVDNLFTLEKLLKSKDLNELKLKSISENSLGRLKGYFDKDYLEQLDSLKEAIDNGKIKDITELKDYVSKNNLYMLDYLGKYSFTDIKNGLNNNSVNDFHKIANIRYIKDTSQLGEYLKGGSDVSSKDLNQLVRDSLGNDSTKIDVSYFAEEELVKYMDLEKLSKSLTTSKRNDVFSLSNINKTNLVLSETDHNYRDYISGKVGYLNPHTRQANTSLLDPRIDILNPINEEEKEHKTVIKKVSEDGNPLQGVEFILERKNSEGVKERIGSYKTNNEGRINLTNLKEGTYFINEVRPLDGYKPLESPVKFELSKRLVADGGGGLTTKTFIDNQLKNIIEIVNYKEKPEELKTLNIKKVDENNQPLKGAKFNLKIYALENELSNSKYLLPNGEKSSLSDYNKEEGISTIIGDEEFFWERLDPGFTGYQIILESGEDGRLYYPGSKKEFKTAEGKYWIKEISAPEGYIRDTRGYKIDLSNSDNELIIKNKVGKKELKVRKTDVFGENLEGASFSLKMYRDDNKIGDKYLLPDGKKVSLAEYNQKEIISDTFQNKKINWKKTDDGNSFELEKVLVSGKDGKLYYPSTEIPFMVIDGVYLLEEIEAPYKYIKTNERLSINTAEIEDEIVIKNKRENDFSVIKIGEDQSFEEGLAGAEFEVSKSDRTETFFTTEYGELLNLEGQELEFDDEYIELREIKAPSGYDLKKESYRIRKNEVNGLQFSLENNIFSLIVQNIEEYKDRLVLEGVDYDEDNESIRAIEKLEEIELTEQINYKNISLTEYYEKTGYKYFRIYDKTSGDYILFSYMTSSYRPLVIFFIVNEKIPNLVKVDEHGAPLGYGEFNLEMKKLDNKVGNKYLLPNGDLVTGLAYDAKTYVEMNIGDQVVTWKKNKVKDSFEIKLESNESGGLFYKNTNVMFEFLEGNYILTETKAPAGYLKKKDSFRLGLKEVDDIKLYLENNVIEVYNKSDENVMLEVFDESILFGGWSEIKLINSSSSTKIDLSRYYKEGLREKFRIHDRKTGNTFFFSYGSDTVTYAISNEKALNFRKVNEKEKTLRNAIFEVTMPKEKNKVDGGYLLPDGSVVTERQYNSIGKTKIFNIDGQITTWEKEGDSLKIRLTSKLGGELYYGINIEPLALVEGHYEVEEVKAPAGYLKKKKTQFNLGKNELDNLRIRLKDNNLILKLNDSSYKDNRFILQGWSFSKDSMSDQWVDLESITKNTVESPINLDVYYNENKIKKFRLLDKDTEHYYLFYYNDDEILYSVSNKKMIDFIKTDEEGRKLKNAEFELIMAKEDNRLDNGKILMPDGSQLSEKEYDSLGKEVELSIDGNSTTWEKKSGEDQLSVRLKTKEDGKLYYVGPKRFLDGILEDIFGANPFKFNEGNYILKETEAPEGYLIKKEEIKLGRNEVDNLKLDLTNNRLSLEALNNTYEKKNYYGESRLSFEGRKSSSSNWEYLENISLIEGKSKIINLDKQYSSYRILDRKTGNSYRFSYDGDEIIYSISNERAIDLRKVDEKGNGLVEGLFELISKNQEVRDVLLSESNGKLSYSKNKKTFHLSEEEYSLKELKAPEGYLIKEENFEIGKNKVNGLRLNLNNNILTLKTKDVNYRKSLVFEGLERNTGSWNKIEELSWLNLENKDEFDIEAKLNLNKYKKGDYSSFRIIDKNSDNYFEFVMDSDLITYSITNEKAIEVKKTDEKGNPLLDAGFELIDKDSKEIKKLKSDKLGNLIYEGTNKPFSLLEDQYILEESKAPIGYIKKKDSFEIARNEVDNLKFRLKENILTIEAKNQDYLEDRLYLEKRVYDKWNQEGLWERIENIKLDGENSPLTIDFDNYRQEEDIKFFRIVDDRTGNNFLIPYDSDRIVYSISNKKMLSLTKSDEEYSPLEGAEFDLLMYKEDNTLEDGRIQLPDGSRVSPSQYQNKKLVQLELEGEKVTWEKSNKDGPFKVMLKSKSQGELIYKLRRENIFGSVSYEDGKKNIKLIEGNYRIRETKAPEGYLIKKDEISFSGRKINDLELDLTDNVFTLKSTNDLEAKDLVLEAKDKEGIWKLIEEISVDEDKTYSKELSSKYHEFRLRDRNSENICSFFYDSDEITYFITNERSIKVRKTDELARELSGAKFELFTENDEENKEVVSKKGEDLLRLDNKYILKEKEAPEGYLIKKEIFNLNKNEVDNLRLNLNKNILTILAKDNQYRDRLILRGKNQEGKLQILEEISLDKKGDIYKKKLPTGYEDLELVDRQTGNKFVFSYDDNKVKYLITNERAPKMIKTDESGQIVSNAEFELYMDKEDNTLEDGRILLPDGRLVTEEEYKKINLLEMDLDGENVTWEKDDKDGSFKVGLKSNSQGELVYRLRKLDWLKRPYYEDGNKPIKFLKGKYKLVESKAPEGFLLKKGSIDINKKQIEGLDVGLSNEILSLKLEKGDYKADLVLKGLSEGKWISIDEIELNKDNKTYEKELQSEYESYQILDRYTGNFYSFSLDDDLITYSFVNEKDSSLMKVDSFGNPLGGAEFELRMGKQENKVKYLTSYQYLLPDGSWVKNEDKGSGYLEVDEIDVKIDGEVITWTKVQKDQSRDDFMVKIESRDNGKFYYKGTDLEVVLDKIPAFEEATFNLKEIKAPMGYSGNEEETIIKKNNFDGLGINLDKNKIRLDIDPEEKYKDRLILEGINPGDSKWTVIEKVVFPKNIFNAWRTYEKTIDEKFDKYRIVDIETGNFFVFRHDNNFISYAIRNKRLLEPINLDNQLEFLPGTEFELLMYKDDNKLLDRYALTSKIVLPDGKIVDEKDYKNQKDIEFNLSEEQLKWEKNEDHYKLKLVAGEDGKLYYRQTNKEGKNIKISNEAFSYYAGNYVLKETKSPSGYLYEGKIFDIKRNQVDDLGIDLTYGRLTVTTTEVLKEEYEDRMILKGYKYDEKKDKYIWEEVSKLKFTDNKFKLDLPDYYESFKLVDIKTKNFFSFNADSDLIEFNIISSRGNAIEINKVDERNKPLSGATFELLTNLENPVNPILKNGDKEVELIWEKSNGNKIIEFTIDNEKGKVVLEKLSFGNYKLREIKAPSGYVLDSTEEEFTMDEENSFYKFTIVNKRGWLPESGFTNILGVGVIGLISLLLLAIFYNLNSIRQKNRKG